MGQIPATTGSPFGQGFSMTRSIISALGRTVRSGNSGYTNPEIIQTDAHATINSVGLLLDRKGQVIGSSGANAGVSFAVPINPATSVIPELGENGAYEYAYRGISGA